MEKYRKKDNNIIINNKLFDPEQIYGYPPDHKHSDGGLRYYGNVYNSSKDNIVHGNNGCGKNFGNNYNKMGVSKNHGKYNENYINDEQNYRRSKHNDEIKEIIENGNVKRKTLLYNNIVDSNRQLANKLNGLEMNAKRDSDVKRCINYFNSLRKGNVDIKKILENKNYKELNIPKEHLDNGKFFNYLEYYKKHNLKELIDYFDEMNTKDNNERVLSPNKNKITTSGYSSEKSYSSGNKLNKDEEQKGIPNSKSNEISENKTEDLKTNKNKRHQNPSSINNDETDEKLFYQRKKTKHEKEPDPVFYTIDDLFD